MKDRVSAIVATQDQFLTLFEMEGDERRARVSRFSQGRILSNSAA